jgi:DNA polymerase III sliding clamp (beta) subunit (PCNA family)
MHVIVPTRDFLQMLSKLKPMRSLTTTGFMFAIYTLEAYGDKLRVIVSDNATITSTTEIFATVKEPGKASVNGSEFFQLVAKITPEQNNKAGSRATELKTDQSKLTLSTATNYAGVDKAVKQKRVFSMVNKDLYYDSNFTIGDTGVELELPGLYMADIFRVLARLIANYTSDIAGLTGVLVRCRNSQLFFVVSDGFRIVEIKYPQPVTCRDFDLILPKISCITLQTLIEDGDALNIKASDHKAMFTVDTDGLTTSMTTALVKAFFPPYETIFDTAGVSIVINTKIFLDNVSNVRRAIDDDTYRLNLQFVKGMLNVSNYQSGHSSFTNEEIQLASCSGDANILINGFLLENSLSLLGAPEIKITIPENEKPIIIDNMDDELKVRIAVALANS